MWGNIFSKASEVLREFYSRIKLPINNIKDNILTLTLFIFFSAFVSFSFYLVVLVVFPFFAIAAADLFARSLAKTLAKEEVVSFDHLVDEVCANSIKKKQGAVTLILCTLSCYIVINLLVSTNNPDIFIISATLFLAIIIRLDVSLLKWRLTRGLYGTNAIEATEIVEYLLEQHGSGGRRDGGYRSVLRDPSICQPGLVSGPVSGKPAST